MFGTSPYRSGQGFAPLGQKRNTPSLPPPIRLDLTDLDGQLLQLAERLAPSAEQRQRQQQAWGSVQGLLQALWPDAGVHLFGSAANELDVGGSNDLDVCLEVEGVEETKEARGRWYKSCFCIRVCCALLLTTLGRCIKCLYSGFLSDCLERIMKIS
jgi:hypothetical protein